MEQNKLTVMVVEDEHLLLQAITKKLEITGIDAISCASGQQALDYLANLGRLPDAIWLDYHLKDMDGLTLMSKMKQHPNWGDIPVIVVSNSASQDKVHTMLALGAKQYILKAEHRLDEIIDVVRKIVNDQQSATT